MSSKVHLKALMAGPKAENLAVVRDLIREVLDDHMYWRRNFHPEDPPFVTPQDQSDPEFQRFIDRVRTELFTFLAEAKRGIPFFTPRYIGHMHSDLLIPAIVGYFGAMLYNQNNVASVSSPVTQQLERDVILMLRGMVGYSYAGAPAPARGESVGGYVTTGGTTANLHALWTARNVRTIPLAFALWLRVSKGKVVEYLRKHLDLPDGSLLAAANEWDLFNLPIKTAAGVVSYAAHKLVESGDRVWADRRKVEDMLAKEVVDQFSLQYLGWQGFLTAIEESLLRGKGERSALSRIQILAPAAGHYSLSKSADLLGFGARALTKLRLNDDFTMDTDALHSSLDECGKTRTPVLAVVSVCGTTEEGAIDDLHAVATILRKHAGGGLTAWSHADACYGAYFATLLDPRTDPPPSDDPRRITELLKDVGMELGLAEDIAASLASESSGALSHDQLCRRLRALSLADSIAIDPHKLGYVPYPAGAILHKHIDAWNAVSSIAPYVFRSDEDAQGMTGRYTVEGSRAGATAAACWLAHKTVPLTPVGHGRLIAATLVSTRMLRQALRTIADSDEDIRVAVVADAQTNMMCYVPFHRHTRSFAELTAVTEGVLKRLAPPLQGDFSVVDTELNIPRHSPLWKVWFGEKLGDLLPLTSAATTGRIPANEHTAKKVDDAICLKVIRSVEMSPFAISATVRTDRGGPDTPIFAEFARTLVRVTKDAFRDIRVSSHRGQMHFLVADDDAAFASEVHAKLNAHFPLVTFPSPLTAGTHSEALQELKQLRTGKQPCPLVFLDMAMPDTPGGSPRFDAGLRVLREILAHNAAVAAMPELPGTTLQVHAVVVATSSGGAESLVDDLLKMEVTRPSPRIFYWRKPMTPQLDENTELLLDEVMMHVVAKSAAPSA